MTFVGVLPSVHPPYLDACIATIADPFLAHVVVLDNTTHNLGVAASWNVGVRAMYAQDAEWLVILSAAMRFGDAGGLDFLAHLEAQTGDEWAIEAGPCPTDPTYGFGWHCIAFPRRTFDRVGLFDENFWPAYYEDLDFGHRIRCASGWEVGQDPMWPKVDVDATLASVAHGHKLGGIAIDPHKLAAYYEAKWGTMPGSSDRVFSTPFGDPQHGLDYWPAPEAH